VDAGCVRHRFLSQSPFFPQSLDGPADDQADPRSIASGRRPALCLCLVVLDHLQQRHNLLDRFGCHPVHLPPVRRSSAVCRGRGIFWAFDPSR